ncbi:adenine nucleotide alpha hydrolase [Zobellia barbeyronii]|uniref:Adenine nucleotide alpha hydrolase n=1 Tax=Zobellia barbeyronii TaxID=2748009 RepID=A0ABS5WA37_9FLAO|nr:adenine nucleotide alpha hydrolase [Zobellia barbeyronii]MBT2159685.1 adenine nucleotide alpha hydrolase [Zobellia barbeyronii]
MKKLKTYFNWSTGKDAALAYYHLQRDDLYQVDQFITSINTHHNRVSMHGLRRELLLKQVQEVGLPVTTIELPEEPTMEEYNAQMERAVTKLKSAGYAHCGFGDIFLEDLRAYREEQLKKYDIKCCFPLWQRDTKELLEEFLDLGFKAIVICIKSELLDASFVGREIDRNFIKDLPANVDPCGENGEFHTFCYDGPIFNNPVKFTVGEKVYREYKNPEKDTKAKKPDLMGFWFCDLIPVDE